MRHLVRHFGSVKRVYRSVSGQALIETALVVPFLMMILVGGAELARIEYAAIEVSNAASAAALYGAQNGGTSGFTTGPPGMVQAAKMDAVNLQNVSVSVNWQVVCVDETTGSSTVVAYPWTNPPCPSSVVSASGTGTDQIATFTQINVLVTGTMNTLFHFPGIPSTINLYGQAKQRVVGN